MSPTLEFRYLDVIVRVFKRLPPESRRWLLARLRAEQRDSKEGDNGVLQT